MKRHFLSRHVTYADLSVEERYSVLESRRLPTNDHASAESVSRELTNSVSYMISHKLVHHSKPFGDGEIIKECMVESVRMLCPDKLELFQSISLSRRTVVRRYV